MKSRIIFFIEENSLGFIDCRSNNQSSWQFWRFTERVFLIFKISCFSPCSTRQIVFDAKTEKLSFFLEIIWTAAFVLFSTPTYHQSEDIYLRKGAQKYPFMKQFRRKCKNIEATPLKIVVSHLGVTLFLLTICRIFFSWVAITNSVGAFKNFPGFVLFKFNCFNFPHCGNRRVFN